MFGMVHGLKAAMPTHRLTFNPYFDQQVQMIVETFGTSDR